MYKKYIYCPHCGTKNSSMNKYCTYCGHILPISPILNDSSSDDPYTDNDKLSSANENIMNDIMNDINSIDDLDSTSRSKDYSQKSRASSSFGFSDNENKNSNDIDYSNDPFMNKYNDDLSGTDSNDEHNTDYVNTLRHTSHIKDNADKFLVSRIHLFKHWWHGLSKKSRIVIIVVVSAILFMIVVNVANSGSNSSSNQSSNQSTSTTRNQSQSSNINRVCNTLNNNDDRIDIFESIVPEQDHIEITLDDSATRYAVEDIWSNSIYDSNSDTDIPVHFKDSYTGNLLAVGDSNSPDISWQDE